MSTTGLRPPAADAAGWFAKVAACAFTTLDGEPYARIADVDALPPFLVNLPTDTDLWMFVATNGGLTAGRRDPDGAIFPYETVDRLYDGPHHTGPVTLARWQRPGGAARLWEPLAPTDTHGRHVSRALAKSVLGHRLVFEETDHEAGLVFRAAWAGADDTGWVRTASLENLGRDAVTVRLVDGLRNVLPSGAPLRLHQQSSVLVDAYKRADLDAATRLAMYSLTARIGDRPEPAEELRATTVWCHGLPAFQVALTADALRDFRRGAPFQPQHAALGRRGCYLAHATLVLDPGQRADWHVAVDTLRSHGQVAALRARLREADAVRPWVERSLRTAADGLARIVGSADGLQRGGRDDVAAHHAANVLYNCLRGGVFVDGDTFPRADFAAFLGVRDREVAARHAAFVDALPDEPAIEALRDAAHATGDPALERLCLEYLPLYFGRRHGDPSRPWNRFAIHVREPGGAQALRYEGNWRDVFQNWEALARSFPAFLPNVIAKFVNASTVDGHNPYRITRDGVDWEVLDPRDPWSGIGYWGDHQIVYLLRLLESLRDHAPGALESLLDREVFAYADVPYRIRPYADALANPRSTIVFDDAGARRVAQREAGRGADGRLVHDADGAVRHASLLEKLLVPALAKLSNFVPDGGLWLNTERPEWNDANNALAGNGLSVVTLCHLRRYLRLLAELAAAGPAAGAPVAVEVVGWLRDVAAVFAREDAAAPADGVSRRRVMDALGAAVTTYRGRVYAHGLSARVVLGPAEVIAWCRDAGAHVDRAIRANRRDDGLYHAYHLLDLGGDAPAVRPLGVMLEGQVAALSSGLVEGRDAVAVIDALFASGLYDRARNAFLLYPGRELPAYLERNRVPRDRAAAVPLLTALLAAGDTSIVEFDTDGVLRFHADFGTARDVAAAVDRLGREPRWTAAAARDRDAIVRLFVQVFHHDTFTGRSGAMVAYEGIGCVYWHMVSKLLLAVQEVALRARDRGEPRDVCVALARAYYRIRGGLGYERSVADYGAFPTDPYSHTPAHAGAQQPGMTGQVKEEILTRFGELGVRVHDGVLAFEPVLLRRDEFANEPGPFRWFDPAGAARERLLPAGALAFTYCQVAVVYTLVTGAAAVRVVGDDGVVVSRAGGRLTRAESDAVLGRRGGVVRIEVDVPERILYPG